MRLEKKNVLVFGSGISGIGACRLLEENGADVIFMTAMRLWIKSK